VSRTSGACRSTPITGLDDRYDSRGNEEATLGMVMLGMNVGEHLSFYTYEAETVVRLLADSIQSAPSVPPGRLAARI
jgi:hypothetical protein